MIIWMILWLCTGSLALGVLVVQANKKETALSFWWFPLGILLGPIFLCFVLPFILSKSSQD